MKEYLKQNPSLYNSSEIVPKRKTSTGSRRSVNSSKSVAKKKGSPDLEHEEKSEVEDIDSEEEEKRKNMIEILSEKKRLEEESRFKMQNKSQFDTRVNKKIQKRVYVDDSRFSRVANVTHINDELFENSYKVC